MFENFMILYISIFVLIAIFNIKNLVSSFRVVKVVFISIYALILPFIDMATLNLKNYSYFFPELSVTEIKIFLYNYLYISTMVFFIILFIMFTVFHFSWKMTEKVYQISKINIKKILKKICKHEIKYSDLIPTIFIIVLGLISLKIFIFTMENIDIILSNIPLIMLFLNSPMKLFSFLFVYFISVITIVSLVRKLYEIMIYIKENKNIIDLS